MREEAIRRKFPRLRNQHLRITSPPDVTYNCIAWAVGDSTKWWSTDAFPEGLFVRPKGVSREPALHSWMAALTSLRFQACENGRLERGYEKVAIFAVEGSPRHVARQLPSGLWTSKLGSMEDIEHELDGLGGSSYGEVVAYMRRPVER